MDRYYVGRVTITGLGFLMGAVIAMSIVPGDTLVVVGTGIVFGFSARALFDQGFLGHWPLRKSAARKTLAAKPSTGHR